MFDVAWDELALIAVISVIVIGPKDLPKVMRQAGRWARKAREMAAEFQRGVDEMMRESELAELKQQVEKASDTTALRRQVEAAIDPDHKIAEGLAPPVLDAPSVHPAAAVPPPPAADPQPAPAPQPATPAASPTVEPPQTPPEP